MCMKKMLHAANCFRKIWHFPKYFQCDQTGINQAMPNLPVEFLQKMRTALHGESKCFPGSRLVHWVMTEGLNNCQTGKRLLKTHYCSLHKNDMNWCVFMNNILL